MKRNNIDKCRKLRKNQTDAERKLWSTLRNRQLSGLKFRRQFPIGRYILDFYSLKYKLGIEADGGQHYEEKGMEKDRIRARELSRYGVYEVISKVVEDRKNKSPHPSLSPKGRGENR